MQTCSVKPDRKSPERLRNRRSINLRKSSNSRMKHVSFLKKIQKKIVSDAESLKGQKTRLTTKEYFFALKVC